MTRSSALGHRSAAGAELAQVGDPYSAADFEHGPFALIRPGIPRVLAPTGVLRQPAMQETGGPGWPQTQGPPFCPEIPGQRSLLMQPLGDHTD
jgi:hypothetical protein